MSEKEFWEDDPQLYWAYHIFYKKKQEIENEKEKYNSWLLGNMNYISTSCSLRDGFSKEEAKGFPTYDKLFNNNRKSTPKTEKDKDIYVQKQNNAWARF